MPADLVLQAHMLDRACCPWAAGAGYSIERLGDHTIDKPECREFADTFDPAIDVRL
jgi:hypothetical protein